MFGADARRFRFAHFKKRPSSATRTSARIFVPSGGGQWAVQGPIIVKAAQAMDLSIPKSVMALSYGDEWTNLLQPFWALPLLGITGLKAKQIVGYTLIVMFVTGIVFLGALLVIPA